MSIFADIVSVGLGLGDVDDGLGLPLVSVGVADGLLLVGVGDAVAFSQPLFQIACPVESQFSPGNGGLSMGGMMSSP